jgi:hypothetical protein
MAKKLLLGERFQKPTKLMNLYFRLKLLQKLKITEREEREKESEKKRERKRERGRERE